VLFVILNPGLSGGTAKYELLWGQPPFFYRFSKPKLARHPFGELKGSVSSVFRYFLTPDP
jgi:hypothetical protein